MLGYASVKLTNQSIWRSLAGVDPFQTGFYGRFKFWWAGVQTHVVPVVIPGALHWEGRKELFIFKNISE